MSRRIANGRWRTLRRGVFTLAETWDAADRCGRAVLMSQAAVLAVTGPAWVSHASAAALRHLPQPLHDDRTWLTRTPPGSTVNTEGLTVEVATLGAADQRVVDGLPTTSLRRTVADCLRHCRPADALAIADAADRQAPGIATSVVRVLDDCANWPYVGRGVLVLPLVDGRRESPLESWSAWAMRRAGLPCPEPQVELYDRHGTFLGRADFWWDEPGVAGEADGRTKYAVVDGLDADAATERLMKEKEREEAMRRAGVEVTRWGAKDLARPERWARELGELLRAGPSRFTGTTRSTSLSTPGHEMHDLTP